MCFCVLLVEVFFDVLYLFFGEVVFFYEKVSFVVVDLYGAGGCI